MKKLILSKFQSDKVKIIRHGRRLKYKEAFEFTSTHLKGQICILSNLDVYYDHTLRYLHNNSDMTAKLYAITRYDTLKDGSFRFNEWLARLCQDSWIFESPVPWLEMDTDFSFGQPGCDNRIVFEFQKIGWKVSNPCKRIIVRHLHVTEKRNYSKTNTVKGGYALATPTDIL